MRRTHAGTGYASLREVYLNTEPLRKGAIAVDANELIFWMMAIDDAVCEAVESQDREAEEFYMNWWNAMQEGVETEKIVR